MGQHARWSGQLGAAVSISAILLGLLDGVMGEKCYKDDSLGDRDGNVYYCQSSGLPRCCLEEAQPTCCISMSEKNWTEQLQLWGVVGAMVLIIGVLFVCCKNDVSFCNNETSLRDRWSNFRNRKRTANDRQVLTQDQYYDNPLGDLAGPSGRGYPDPYRYPPLPATPEKIKNFHTYQPSYA